MFLLLQCGFGCFRGVKVTSGVVVVTFGAVAVTSGAVAVTFVQF